MKQQRSDDHSSKRSPGLSQYNYLFGKVVLLIGNDTAILPTLVTQLAQKGADIALVFQQLSRDTLRFVKENVELLGQRFMLIENPQNLNAPTEQIIQLVVSRFKRVDVFIDLSAGNSEQPGMIASNHSPAIWRRSNWPLMLAVVRGFAKP
jgi:hypothetical protein